MSGRTIILAALVALGSMGAWGCEDEQVSSPAPGVVEPVASEPVTVDDVHREVGEAVETTAVFLNQQQRELMDETKGRLDEIRAQMETLGREAEVRGDAAKLQWSQMQADLEIKLQAAGDRMAKIKDTTGEALKDLKAGLDAAIDDVKRGLDNARARIETHTPELIDDEDAGELAGDAE